MAEKEHQWLQRHTHEANIVSYGTVGRATYDQQEKAWIFSREFDNQVENDDFDAHGTIVHSPLRLLNDDAEIVLERNCVESEGDIRPRDISKLARRLPELAAGFETVRRIAKRQKTKASPAPVGQLMDFGGAAWLQEIEHYDPRHLSVPIAVSVVGHGASTLRLASVTQKLLDYTISVDITPEIYVPSLTSESASTWSSTEPILQVLFSNRHHGGHSNTFLAVRQASQTTIFQPSRSGALTASSHDFIQPNNLISIDLAVTGGHSHADVVFHPYLRWRIAIIDVEGNWSIWCIQGRRSRTARILYHAQLSVSGKIFSWTHQKRPEGVGLYYDGWHRLLWLSSTNSEIDRLLVCNRQIVKLFDLKGDEMCSIDARLDRTKVLSYIVDVKRATEPGMCFILTTTKLLLFDITQKEWRDTGRMKGPALLCAWYHYYNYTDLSLSLSTVERGDEILVALYSRRVPQLRTHQLKIVKVNGKHSIISSSPTSIELPTTSKSKIVRILLALVEAKPRQRGLEIKLPHFIEIVIQHEDLTVSSLSAIWQSSESTTTNGDQHEPLIKLPPRRDSRIKSEHRVDLADDEDDQGDLVGFIVPDSTSPFEADPLPFSSFKLSNEQFKRVTFSKHMPGIANHLISLQHAAAPSSKSSISKAFTDLSKAIRGLQSSENNLVSQTISELFTETPRLDDAEDDSVILSQAIEDLAQQISNDVVISNVGAKTTPPLAQTYEELFDKNVSALPSSMPNRARIQREWVVREIALDLKLSSHYIHRQIHEADRDNSSRPAAQADPSLANSDVLSSDAIIFSDPLQAIEIETSHQLIPNIAHISASQPQPTTSEPRNVPIYLSPATSHLQTAISRLSALTNISPLASTSIPESAEDHITDLLTHLPNSIDLDTDTDAADPRHYNWATAELNAASARAPDSSTLTNASDPKAKRKAERLAKARRRADEIRREVERDQERRSVVPTVMSSQLQPPATFHDNNNTGRRTRVGAEVASPAGDRDRDTATLVYRASPARPRVNFDLPISSAPDSVRGARNGQREPWSQPSHLGPSVALSDAIEGPESSSQAQIRNRSRDEILSTQPERGVLGARVGGVGLVNDREQEQKKKKKKAVIPGFG